MTRRRSKSLKRVALSRRIRIVGKAPSRMPLAFFRLTAPEYHNFQRGEERIILADAGTLRDRTICNKEKAEHYVFLFLAPYQKNFVILHAEFLNDRSLSFSIFD